MQSPGVSVVMAVYNGERFLAESVESVLAQTIRDFELIVVDDGSTDSSLQIAERFAARDARVRVVPMTHGGVSRAVNLGIRAARYDLIARTDSDDRMLPNRIERQVSFLGEHPWLDVLCSYSYFINAAGKRIGSSARTLDLERGKREFRPSLFVELTQSTVLMKKTAFLEAGAYRDFPYAEDRDLWGRCATSGLSIGCQPEFLVEFRLHGGSVTMRNALMQHEACCFIDHNVVRRLRELPELTLEEFRHWKRKRPLRSRLRETLDLGALHAFKKASRHYGEGRYCQCALTLAAAVTMNPVHILGRVRSKVQQRDGRVSSWAS